MVYWILGWFRVESLCNYCRCCVLKPLLSDIMVDFIIWWFQLQVATYAGNKMCSKGMDDKFVSYIKHLHPLVNLFAVDVFSDVTEWAGRLGSPQKMRKMTRRHSQRKWKSPARYYQYMYSRSLYTQCYMHAVLARYFMCPSQLIFRVFLYKSPPLTPPDCFARQLVPNNGLLAAAPENGVNVRYWNGIIIFITCLGITSQCSILRKVTKDFSGFRFLLFVPKQHFHWDSNRFL